MRDLKQELERMMKETDTAIKRAGLANDSFTHLFGEPTAREDRERTEIETMREGE